MPDGAAIIDHLAHGPLHRFADWPNANVPRVAIGLYSVWRDEEFIYIGMAGRASEAVLHSAHEAGRACGLRDRLRSHATGRRSGDQFCIYVADRLVLPELNSDQISAVASGRLSLDALVCDYIQQHLGYRFYAFPALSVTEQQAMRRLERHIQQGESPIGRPLLNPLPLPGSPPPPVGLL